MMLRSLSTVMPSYIILRQNKQQKRLNLMFSSDAVTLYKPPATCSTSDTQSRLATHNRGLRLTRSAAMPYTRILTAKSSFVPCFEYVSIYFFRSCSFHPLSIGLAPIMRTYAPFRPSALVIRVFVNATYLNMHAHND